MAKYAGGWSTYDWLEARATDARNFASLEDFAVDLQARLDSELSRIAFREPLHQGIGIHLIGYEHINDYWIPELFLISNYADTSYSSLRRLGCSRETYHWVGNVGPEDYHRGKAYRLMVKEALDRRAMLWLNNGDPAMFNSIANAVMESARTAQGRGVFKERDDISTYRALAKQPVEIVRDIQRNFFREGKRRVGGRIHDLSVTPAGEYDSNSGDGP